MFCLKSVQISEKKGNRKYNRLYKTPVFSAPSNN